MRDLRYAVRSLGREPGYTCFAILIMALGIAATTALASVAYGVLLKPLPWAEADRLVRVTETRQGRTARIPGTITNGTYLAWREQPETIEAIGGWTTRVVTLTGAGDAARTEIASLTPSMFDVLRARPLIGRALNTEDAATGGNYAVSSVVLLSFALWQQRFGGREDAVGRTVYFDGRPRTIVGVMPRDFAFPDRNTQAWGPMAVGSVIGDGGVRRIMIFQALARLRPGATPAQAAAEGTARARAGEDAGMAALAMFGVDAPPDVSAKLAVDAMTEEVRPAIVILLAAVALLLAAATANIANLQLARSISRRREIAIRSALGAGSRRIVRQLLAENLVLGMAGGLAGCGFAWLLLRLAPRLLPADFPRLDQVALDLPVLVCALAVAIAAGVAFGLAPALQTRRLNLLGELAESGGGAALPSGRTTARFRAAVMALQIAIACVLLVGAALLGRSFDGLLNADRGYEPANLLTADVPMPDNMFPAERRAQVVNQIVDRLGSVPGVLVAGSASGLPLSRGTGGSLAFRLRARDGREMDVQARLRVVTPGYFGALRIPVLQGRAFDGRDTATSPVVAMVNRAFARQYLGAETVGARLPISMRSDDREQVEIVGIVDDVQQGAIGQPIDPEVLLPVAQVRNRQFDATLVVRTQDDPLTVVPALRTIVRETDPLLALDSIATMEERVARSLARPRLYAMLLATFAGFAIAIAMAGLFAVLSYGVARRSREIGIRAALGARPADVVRLVVGQAAWITLVGLGLGLVSARIAATTLSSLLYGIAAHDPVWYTAVAVLLCAVAATACILPARRAARVDPLSALRS